MIEQGATHVGVATDHVIESFRNDLWPGYKTGAGIEPALLAQFHPLEEALRAMGVAVWPMIELEADDALASAARIADADAARRQGVHLDAGQGPRAVRARRSRGAGGPQGEEDPRCRRRAREVRRRPGADSRLPRARRRRGRRLSGHRGHRRGHRGAAARTGTGAIEDFPADVLGEQRDARAALQGPRDAARPTRRSSTTSTRCGGPGRRRTSTHGASGCRSCVCRSAPARRQPRCSARGAAHAPRARSSPWRRARRRLGA